MRRFETLPPAMIWLSAAGHRQAADLIFDGALQNEQLWPMVYGPSAELYMQCIELAIYSTLRLQDQDHSESNALDPLRSLRVVANLKVPWNWIGIKAGDYEELLHLANQWESGAPLALEEAKKMISALRRFAHLIVDATGKRRNAERLSSTSASTRQG